MRRDSNLAGSAEIALSGRPRIHCVPINESPRKRKLFAAYIRTSFSKLNRYGVLDHVDDSMTPIIRVVTEVDHRSSTRRECVWWPWFVSLSWLSWRVMKSSLSAPPNKLHGCDSSELPIILPKIFPMRPRIGGPCEPDSIDEVFLGCCPTYDR